jgi:BolA protein
MRERLATLQPLELELTDESAMHASHEGAKSGGGHFRLRIVSPQFAGKRTIERHRLIHDSLGNLMHREIHALSIAALAPGES